MRTLELGPADLWICAPDVAAVGEAMAVERRDHGEMRRFWVRPVPACGGERNGRVAHNFFFQEESARGLSAVMVGQRYLTTSGDEAYNETHWLRYINWQHGWGLARACLPGIDPFVSVRMEPSSGAVFARDHFTSGPGVSFSLDTKRDYNDFPWWPQSELEARVSAEFEDENSQLRRAYEWRRRDEKERTDYAFRCENGSARELLYLIRCLVFNDRSQGEPIFYRDVTDTLMGRRFDAEHPTALEEWMEKIVEVMRPAFLRAGQLDVEKRHLEKIWKARVGWPRYQYPTDESVPLSAHERLETQLYLRDWALKHAPAQAQHFDGSSGRAPGLTFARRNRRCNDGRTKVGRSQLNSQIQHENSRISRQRTFGQIRRARPAGKSSHVA